MTRRGFFVRLAMGIGAVVSASLLGACQEPVGITRPAVDARPTPTPLPSTPVGTAVEARPAARAAPAVTVKRGGSIVWAAESDPLDLDPLGPASLSALPILGDLVYQSLVMFDENLKVTPCLAESWTLADPTHWTFKLREGVRMHDGNELDAEDVAFWFDRLTKSSPASPFRAEYGQIERVEVKSRYEVNVTSSAPHAPLLVTLASMRGSAIVSRRWLAANAGAMKTSAIGSGPFKIAEYVPGKLVRYVKHPDYWESSLPYLDDVTLRIVPDEAERVTALRSGDVSYAAVSPEAARRLKSEKNLSILATPGPVQHRMTFNLRRKPFDDVRVRRAVALAVDRRAVLERALDGDGKLTGPIPTGLGSWSGAPEELPNQRDLKQAKQLLADADYADGLDATIKLPDSAPIAASAAALLADQLKAVGIRLNVARLSEATLRQVTDANDFDLLWQVQGFLPDPDSYLSPAYWSQGSQNASGFQNQAFDDLLDQARTQLDPTARKRLYDQAVRILFAEVPSIWMFTENNSEVLHTSIKGYSQSFTGRLFLKQTWLDTKQASS